MSTQNTTAQLMTEIKELHLQLKEANASIEAIRMGLADAFVVKGEDGHQRYTLTTTDQTFRVLVEKMREGAVTLNKNGIILYCNSRFAEMAGLSLNRVIGQRFDQFINQYTADKLNHIIASGNISDYKTEETLISSDFSSLSVLMSITNLNLEEGTAFSILLTDLTHQKETQQVLRIKNEELEKARNEALELNNILEDTVNERTKDLSLSREHFMLLADSIPQITWTNLPSGQLNFFNKRWYDYTGLSFDPTFEECWEHIVHPEDLPATREKFNSCIKTGQVFEIENRYKRNDGIYRWHLNRSIPLKNETGELLFWVGTATDIDDQRKSIDKKDEFIGIASHELKTPLTSLSAYLQLISNYKKETIPEQVKTFIVKAESSINRLHILVNDLLDVSKIQAGKLHFRQCPLNVDALISTCAENAAYMFPDYNIIYKAGTDAKVNGNVERLERVLMNLINNAVKYSPLHKDIILSVTKEGSQLRISVTDYGIGLSASQKDKIFERFYRVDEQDFMASGLGMGLYISMDIIKNHKGTIGVQSRINKGSTFYILLPLLL
ncbi:two-component system CheB/CheR fusion protein [Pedobacter cryoconitis]|uniref:PAS domain-containing sensor histidine kinase n=1 Tax=Pedobacter cryoconitis TaxID=188932 RepID=UPI00160FB863|nr:ATP-binding protein [Pedobacter cryoconitis]MBB6270513.1 two-component system CheB/CheR fusion protein [Pedobacter cryoconitis]